MNDAFLVEHVAFLETIVCFGFWFSLKIILNLKYCKSMSWLFRIELTVSVTPYFGFRKKANWVSDRNSSYHAFVCVCLITPKGLTTMQSFILIVLFATSSGQIDNKIVQEFSTKAQCLTVLRTAIMNKQQVKRQVLSSGCYPK